MSYAALRLATAHRDGPWSPWMLPRSLLRGFVDFENTSRITNTAGRVAAITDCIAGSSWAEVSSSGPSLITSTVTGRQVASFNGTANYLQIATVPAAFPLSGAMEWWVIGTQDVADADGTTRYALCAGGASNNWIGLGRRSNGGKSQILGVTNNTNAPGPSVSTLNYSGRHVVRSVWDGTNQIVSGDGIVGNTFAVSASGNNTRIRLGASATTTANSFWQGEISAVLQISGNLSAQDANNLFIWSRIRLGI